MVFNSVIFITPCLTQRLSPESRTKLKQYYRSSKKYGIRAMFGFVGGTGIYSILQEVAKEGIRCHGKRYIGIILINSGLTFISCGIPLMTNTTKVLKYSKACHSICAATWRASHNVAELPLILCDYVIFGEYLPSCGEADYDIFSDTTDILSPFSD
jgi:hypothetical protein